MSHFRSEADGCRSNTLQQLRVTANGISAPILLHGNTRNCCVTYRVGLLQGENLAMVSVRERAYTENDKYVSPVYIVFGEIR